MTKRDAGQHAGLAGTERIRGKAPRCLFHGRQLVFRRSWLVILCVLSFSGCASLVQQSAGVHTIVTEPGAHIGSQAPPNFGLVGRIAVKGVKESFSGGFQWRHTESSDDMLLLSPLGQALAQLKRTPEGVHLTTAERENYYASDVESLTEQVLGWRLPIMGLQYWVRSKNSPSTASAIDLDNEGRIMAIRQDGWEIIYSSYFPDEPVQATSQADRARILQLKRSGLQIKLVIDRWDSIDQ